MEIPNGAFIGKITNDAREEEMEENMEQVSQCKETKLLFFPLTHYVVREGEGNGEKKYGETFSLPLMFLGVKYFTVRSPSVIQVSAMIGNLRNMASDMNGELENQNQQLDRINLKATSDITRVKMANDKAAALMK